MKKRIISLIMIFCMCFAMTAFAGEEAPAEAGPVKIGVVWPGFMDDTGFTMKSLMDQAAAVLGVELTYVNGDFDSSAQLTSIETLINAGADGIIFGPWSDSSWPKVVELCEAANVPFLSIHRDIGDQEVKDLVFASPMFAGIVVENEYENACHIAEFMVKEAGVKHIALMTNPPGFTTDDLRRQGYLDTLNPYVESGEVAIDVEYTFPTSDTTTAVSDAVDNFCLAYPDLDAIIAGGAGYGIGESMMASLAKNGKAGDITIGSFDVFSGLEDGIKSGEVSILCGGHVSTGMWGVVVLYNKIIGHPLSENGRIYYTNYIYFTEEKDIDFYKNYLFNPEVQLWTDEEIAQMSALNNPEFNEKALEDIIATWSVDGIVERIENR